MQSRLSPRSARHGRWRWAACAVGLLAGLPHGVGCRDREQAPQLLGRRAPTFKLDTLDHRRFYLREQLGKPVVLVFWNTSCQVCKRELSELESLRNEVGSSRVVVASVCQDPENIDLARAFVQDLGLGYPTLLDQGGRVTAELAIDTFPTTLVVSPSGEVGFMRVGYTEPLMHQLRGAIDGYLAASGHAD